MIPVLIIPVLNRYDLLDKSLESIDYPIGDILIINNGLEEYVPKRKDLTIRVLDMPSNQGISGSWNLGIKSYPHAPWWLISSADTSFLPGSLEQFAKFSSAGRCVKSNASYSAFLKNMVAVLYHPIFRLRWKRLLMLIIQSVSRIISFLSYAAFASITREGLRRSISVTDYPPNTGGGFI